MKYFDLLKEALDSVMVEGDGLRLASNLVLDVRKRGCNVFFIGNGGSAAIASHMAIDFENKGKVAAACFNDPASLTCISNDYGYDVAFERRLMKHGKRGDLLFAISSSGRSRSILLPALAFMGVGTVITLSGFHANNPLRTIGNLNFYVPSDRYWVVENAHMAILHVILENVAA